MGARVVLHNNCERPSEFIQVTRHCDILLIIKPAGDLAKDKTGQGSFTTPILGALANAGTCFPNLINSSFDIWRRGADVRAAFPDGLRRIRVRFPSGVTCRSPAKSLRVEWEVNCRLFDTLVGKTLIGSNEPRYGYGEVKHTTHSLQCRKPACCRGGGEHITIAYRRERNQAEVK